jgi:hypothetical protein
MEELDEYQKEEIRVEAVAKGLRDAGLSASAQDTGGDTICVIVDRTDEGQIVWGTADVNWAAAVEDADGEFISGIETNCPSDMEDVPTIVSSLKKASLAHGAIVQSSQGQ